MGSGCTYWFPKLNMKAKAINIRSIQIRFCLQRQRETTKLPSCKSNGNDCRMKLAYNEQRFLFIGARGRVPVRAFSCRFSFHFASPLRRGTDDDSEREKHRRGRALSAYVRTAPDATSRANQSGAGNNCHVTKKSGPSAFPQAPERETNRAYHHPGLQLLSALNNTRVKPIHPRIQIGPCFFVFLFCFCLFVFCFMLVFIMYDPFSFLELSLFVSSPFVGCHAIPAVPSVFRLVFLFVCCLFMHVVFFTERRSLLVVFRSKIATGGVGCRRACRVSVCFVCCVDVCLLAFCVVVVVRVLEGVSARAGGFVGCSKRVACLDMKAA